MMTRADDVGCCRRCIFSLQGFPTPRPLSYGKIHNHAPHGRVPCFSLVSRSILCWRLFVGPTSNEYHLSRVIMVHEISESVSLLSPLKQLDASWGYEHVPYPYACYDDENKKFQARRFCHNPPPRPTNANHIHRELSLLCMHGCFITGARSEGRVS